MSRRPIYMDYMATTPADERVIEKMNQYMGVGSNFGNPSSHHAYGQAAKGGVCEATDLIAGHLNCQPNEIIYTSGATESNNMAIQGVAQFYQRNGKHIITSCIEHKATLDSCAHLESLGFEVTYLTPDADGIIHPAQVIEALRDDTLLVSLHHVNSEIGVIQPIQELGEAVKARGAFFHVDAAQSAGKLPIDLSQLPVDLLSISGHKMYGPKGIGLLYVRSKPKVRLTPLIFGGAQQQGLRSGTIPVALIAGLGVALDLCIQTCNEEHQRLGALQKKIMDALLAIDGVYLNGHRTERLVNNLNFSVAFVEGDALHMAIREIACSRASACSSDRIEPSYVLRAIGVEPELANSAIRLSIGRYTTDADVQHAIEVIQTQIKRLRQLSPFGDGIQVKERQYA